MAKKESSRGETLYDLRADVDAITHRVLPPPSSMRTPEATQLRARKQVEIADSVVELVARQLPG